MRVLLHALFAATLLVGCSGTTVITGHGIGPVIPCRPEWCEDATADIERVVGRPILSIEWHEEIFLDKNGSPILIDVGGLSRPVGVAVVRLPGGVTVAVSVACGPVGCDAYP